MSLFSPQNAAAHKPYFISMPSGELPAITAIYLAGARRKASSKRTPIYDVHKQLGAKVIPFAGWEMPVWYTSVLEEHLATRQAAGLFDVAHMGVYQAEGRRSRFVPR